MIRRLSFYRVFAILLFQCGRTDPPAPLTQTAATTTASNSTEPSAGRSVVPSVLPSVLADATIANTDGTPILDEVLAEASVSDAQESGEKFYLGAKHNLTQIYPEPKFSKHRLGYLRAGAIVEREANAAGTTRCPKGWYAIKPRGFVCIGEGATLDLNEPLFKLNLPRPNLQGPLPYPYVITRTNMAPLYVRIPSAQEARSQEYDLESHLRYSRYINAPFIAKQDGDAGLSGDASAPDLTSELGRSGNYKQPFRPDGPPDFLREGKVAPNVLGGPRSPKALHAGRPIVREGFALLGSFISGPSGALPTGGTYDRRFDLTTEMFLLPHDRLKEVKPSSMRGIHFGEHSMPAAFVRARYTTSKLVGPKLTSVSVPPRTGFLLTGQSKRIQGNHYHEIRGEDAWIKSDHLVMLTPPKVPPAFAHRGEKWIEISITRQALVAWEGLKPVFATLVSTGRDGLGDADLGAMATVRGHYRIGNKHVSITMDSDAVGEEFSLRDVPYVQYFHEGYALHAAYWHDGFGEPRSHGCVNLSEIDAAWLFNWTGPELPAGWHGVAAFPLSTGTQLWIHP